MSFLSTRPHLKWVLITAITFWICGCFLALHRYYNFFPTYVSFDQGIFNQVFWNNLHGRWFESSLSSTEAATVMQGQAPEVFYRRLGQHFTPALLLWLPWYKLFSSPAGLSVLQVSLVAIAGLLLYPLARKFHSPQLSAWLTVSYYAANAVISPMVANFHDICQIPLYTFALFLAFENRWRWLLVILVPLILAVREDTGILLFGIGLFWMLSRRSRQLNGLKIGAAVCLVSVIYVITVTNVVMPLFSSDVSKRFMVEQFGQFVGNQEASTLEVMRAIASQPLLFLSELLTPPQRTVLYLLGQWIPLAFIPAIAPECWILVALPLLNTLIRQDPTALSLHLRYAMVWVPPLFYGAILWWARHQPQFNRRVRRFWAFCLAVSLLFTVTANPNRVLSFAIPDSFQPWVYVSPMRQWQHSSAVRSLFSQIPDDASVSATDQLVAHLSNRREILRFPMVRLRNDARQEIRVDYLIADLWYLQQYQVAFTDDRKTFQAFVDRIDRFLTKDRYGLIDFRDGVVLLQRRAKSRAEAIAAWRQFADR
jgi:uncharacterized membrane protein